jgi:hypothetical protein
MGLEVVELAGIRANHETRSPLGAQVRYGRYLGVACVLPAVEGHHEVRMSEVVELEREAVHAATITASGFVERS